MGVCVFMDERAAEHDSTRGCRVCDAKKRLGASETYRCKCCGYKQHRDVSAAHSIFPANVFKHIGVAYRDAATAGAIMHP